MSVKYIGNVRVIAGDRDPSLADLLEELTSNEDYFPGSSKPGYSKIRKRKKRLTDDPNSGSREGYIVKGRKSRSKNKKRRRLVDDL